MLFYVVRVVRLSSCIFLEVKFMQIFVIAYLNFSNVIPITVVILLNTRFFMLNLTLSDGMSKLVYLHATDMWKINLGGQTACREG